MATKTHEDCYTAVLMDFSLLFIRSDGHLRAGWRLLLFIMVFLLALPVIGWVAQTASPISLEASVFVLAAAVITATWGMMRLIERKPLIEIGLTATSKGGRELEAGLLVGAAMVGAIVAFEWSTGLITFRTVPASGASLPAALWGSALLFVAAANEEVLFRGYPFQRLIEGAGSWIAVGLSAVLFGVMHYANPHLTPLGVTNTMLAGVWLSVAYLRTKALWLPIGAHFSWNWTLALLGLPVSGLDLLNTPWTTEAVDTATWLHGGDYGPEGGLVGSFALGLGLVLVLAVTRHKQASGEPERVAHQDDSSRSVF